MSDNRSSSTGVSFATVVLVVFVILKLTDNVTWSWFWVLSPLWISAAILAVIALVLLVGNLVVIVAEKRRQSRDLAERFKQEIRR